MSFMARSLTLAEDYGKSSSSYTRSGFRPDVLVTCQGGNKMLQMLADALFSACVELQVSTCRVCCRGLLRRSRACLRGICRLNWHGLGRTNTPGATGTGRPSIRPLTNELLPIKLLKTKRSPQRGLSNLLLNLALELGCENGSLASSAQGTGQLLYSKLAAHFGLQN